MKDYYFISYSRADSAQFSLNLADTLTAGPPSVSVWIDERNRQPGIDWDDQIVEAIRACRGLLFIMSEDSIKSGSVCKDEWVRAMKYKKPVIPLFLLNDKDADLPFRLESRQYIDFTQSFDGAIAKLRNHLAWVDTPEGVINSLHYQLKDLEREMQRVDFNRQTGLKEEILHIQQRIKEQQELIDNPLKYKESTSNRIVHELELERHPATPVNRQVQNKFINKPLANPPLYFQDRHIETALLGDFLMDSALRIMTVVGRGGIGKTTMVNRLLNSLENGQLPDERGAFDVDGIVYLGGRGDHRVTLPNLYSDLCKLLPESTATLLDTLYQNMQLSIESKMQPLLENFSDKIVLVLLDNFEDLIDSQTSKITEEEIGQALHALLTLPQHGVKIIITSRIKPLELLLEQPGRQMKIELNKGLESPYAENLLRAMDKDGKLGLQEVSDKLLKAVQVRTRGYPRALEAFYAILSADWNSSVEELLNDTRNLLPENVVQVLVGEAYNRLGSDTQQVMQALAIYNRPVPPNAIDFLLQAFIPNVNSLPILKRLVNMHFARREGNSYYLHPVDNSYALGRIPEGTPEDWKIDENLAFTRFFLEHRGAEYYRQVRIDISLWRTINDVNPLLSEFELLFSSCDYTEAWDVLQEMSPFLKLQGYFRQVERLANKLSLVDEEPLRTLAFGEAGMAHSAMGEAQYAIVAFKSALEGLYTEVDPEILAEWRLTLGGCYNSIGDHHAAREEYEEVFNNENLDLQMRILALLNISMTKINSGDYEEANNILVQALHFYLPYFTISVTEEGEVFIDPDAFNTEIELDNPEAWQILGELTNESESDPENNENFIVLGIQINKDINGNYDSQKEIKNDEEQTQEFDGMSFIASQELGHIWMDIAKIHTWVDEFTNASVCCQLALSIYGALGHEEGYSEALDYLGKLAAGMPDSDTEAILDIQEEQLQRIRALGYRTLEISIMNNLAEFYLDEDRLKESEELYIEISNHATNLEDPSLTFIGEKGLAQIEWARGNADVAVEKLESLLKSTSIDLNDQADLILKLGEYEFARFDRDKAVSYGKSASEKYALLGMPLFQVRAERFLASISLDSRKYDDAVSRLEFAHPLIKSLGSPSDITSFLCDLANAYVFADLPEKALHTIDEAIKRAAEIELPHIAAEAQMAIGTIQMELMNFQLAEGAFKKAIDIYQKVDNKYGQILALNQLSWLKNLTEQRDEQIKYARLAWDMTDKIEDLQATHDTRMAFALALSDNELFAEAIDHLNAIIRQDSNNAIAILNLGWVLFDNGYYDKSLIESQKALEIDPTQKEAIKNIGHAYLAMGLPDKAKQKYLQVIRDRKGNENFVETIKVLKKLIAKNPDLIRGNEMLQLFEEEQLKLQKKK